jgi:hypothetical protein
VVWSAGEIAKATRYPKTSIDAAQDVIVDFGRPRSYFLSVLHDSGFIAAAFWHTDLPELRNL